MQPANRTHWNNSIYFWYWELSTEIRFAVGKVSRDKTAVAAGDPIVIWLHIQYRGSTTSLGKVLQKLVCPLLSISLPHKADHQSYSHFCCLGHKSAAGPFISIMSPFPSSVTNKGGGGGGHCTVIAVKAAAHLFGVCDSFYDPPELKKT